MPPKKAVILGGGVAGTSCAAELSHLSHTQSHPLHITLISPHETLKISNSATYLTHTPTTTHISEQKAIHWCEAHDINFVQDAAKVLDKHHVLSSSGERYDFDVCCIATGARPYVPPWATDVWKKVVLLLRDTDSVGRLQREVRHARRVIVVGGGGIGMEVVHELDNCEIVWLLRGLNFGGRFFDNRLAEILEKHVDTQLSSQEPNDGTTSDRKDRDEFDVHGAGVGPEWLGRRTGDTAIFFDRGGMQEERVTERKLRAAANGRCVRIKKECEIKRLEKDESGRWPVVAELSDGNAYGCDLIIVGAGVVPNVDWLQGSGIQLAEEGGIIVNAGSFETSVRGLFAAGDCTHCIPESDTDWFQMRLWTQALTAGRASARNMARYVMDGEGYMGLEYDLFSHATSFFGKDVVFLGRFQAQDVGSGYRMYEREDEDFVRVVVRDRRIVGVVLVGCVERAETYENLMLGRVDIEFLGDGIVAKELELEEYFD